jgi:hypothetical protein
MSSLSALVVLVVEHPEHPAAWKALLAFALLQLLMGIVVWRLFRPSGQSDGGDDGGSDGDDIVPKRPPPDPVICWPEFERQFAEYVARHTPAE